VWAAVHDGYGDLESGGVRHQRVVRLVQEEDAVVVSDLVTGRGPHQVELRFHLGPDVTAELKDGRAQLSWPYRDTMRHATFTLPEDLAWSTHHGETDPPLGWYSPAFGERVPTTTMVGVGRVQGRLELHTQLHFRDPASPFSHALGVGR
jgi:hypothetical protein